MFLKLFKYDMLSIAKKMWIYYVVMLGLSVISGLFTLQANITEQPYSLTMCTFVKASFLFPLYFSPKPVIQCAFRVLASFLRDGEEWQTKVLFTP